MTPNGVDFSSLFSFHLSSPHFFSFLFLSFLFFSFLLLILLACLHAGLALQRPRVSTVPVEFTGEGQMHLNSLHMAEVLTDDSNFRQRAMDSLAAPMAFALSQPPQDFASAWLAGSAAHDAVSVAIAVIPSLHTTLPLHG